MFDKYELRRMKIKSLFLRELQIKKIHLCGCLGLAKFESCRIRGSWNFGYCFCNDFFLITHFKMLFGIFFCFKTLPTRKNHTVAHLMGTQRWRRRKRRLRPALQHFAGVRAFRLKPWVQHHSIFGLFEDLLMRLTRHPSCNRPGAPLIFQTQPK